MATKPPAFHYRRLQSAIFYQNPIRLIRLHPGEDSDPITCEMKHVYLSQRLFYLAISYCWGDQTPSVDIVCENRTLTITENLATALRKLRKIYKKPVLVWVDAICIQQRDDVEKSSQIPLMRQIFERAEFVFIWLGNDTPRADAEKAYSLFPKLIELGKAAVDAKDTRDALEMIRDGDFDRFGIPNLRDQAWRSFAELLERPWFQRVWIIQEVVVSKLALLCCGDAIVSWEEFSIAFMCCVKLDIFSNLQSRVFFNWPVVFLLISTEDDYDKDKKTSGETLLQLLHRHRKCLAKDTRDKIYALLGLADDVNTGILQITPRYNVSSDLVYIDAAKSIIKSSQTLDLLSTPRVSVQSQVGNMPSWVPDWSVSDDAHWFYDMFDSACGSTHSARFSGNLLELDGVVFDEIEDIGSVSDIYTDPLGRGLFSMERLAAIASIEKVLASWEDVSQRRTHSTYVTGEDMLDAYLRTIFVHPLEDLQKAREIDIRWDSHRHWLRRMSYWGLERSPAAFKIAGGALMWKIWFGEWWKGNHTGSMSIYSTNSLCMCRRMMRTRKGYIGLAPGLANKGDRVALFKGSSVPLVIRQKGMDWELIGDCYVHGIMRGEAFREEECETMRIR